MSKQLSERLERVSDAIEVVDTFAVDTLSRLATWLSPLVPAMMVYHAAQAHIVDVDRAQALIAAASIELLGLQVVSNWLNAQEYTRKSGESLPMARYRVMVAAYVSAVLLIVVGLKVVPGVASWLAVVVLSMLTLLSAIAFVSRKQLGALMVPIKERQAQERELSEVQHKAAIKAAKRAPNHDMRQRDEASNAAINAARLSHKDARIAALDKALRSGEPHTTGELAEVVGVSGDTVRRYLSENYNGNLMGNGRDGWHLSE